MRILLVMAILTSVGVADCIRAPKDPKVLYCGSEPSAASERVKALAKAANEDVIIKRNQEWDKQEATQAAAKVKADAEAKVAAEAKIINCVSQVVGGFTATHCE